MRKYVFFIFLIPIAYFAQGQSPSGKVIYDRLYSPSLDNTGGEDPTRRVSIYLPPDYDKTTDRYPVIYYLHGITQKIALSSLKMALINYWTTP